MKKLIIIILLFPIFANAQNTFTAIVKDSLTNELLIGSTAVLKGTTNGSSADINGKIEIKNIPDGKQTIVFNYIGYEKKELNFIFPLADSLKGQIIYLKSEAMEIEEIVVTSTRTDSRIDEIPIKVEVLGGEELNERGSIKPTNISNLLSESTGIQPQQTSAVNGNVSIRLQGLDGKYTQILKDGFPLYSNFAQGLSIMQIPPLDLKQVEVIKGSSSSLYGSDAIAGIINLILKQPEEKRELKFLINQTSLLGTDVNGYFSQRWKKFGFSFLTANNFQPATDVNKDGFSDLPKTQTFNVVPTFYYYFNPTTTLRFGVNGTFDNRKGGDMKVLENEADTLHKFFEENISNRISTQLKFDKQFNNDKSLTIKNSLSYFDRAINQNTSTFKGKQISSYSEVAYNFKVAKHQFVTGFNFITEKFTEDSTKSHLQRNYDYNTTGLFFQDDWKPADKFSLQAGIRTDYQNQFGFFVLPRLALMYKFTKDFYVRAGSGFGYKVPSIFSTASEQEGINNIQPLSNKIKAETSIGGNLDFNYKTIIDNAVSLTLNQSFFVTQINNPIVLDTFNFVNKDKPILTSGFESSVRLRWEELKIFVGYTFVDARRKYEPTQTFVPLTPQNKVVTTIIYEKEEKWMIGFEGFYTSTMFRDLDSKTKDYFIIGLMVQKHFKHFSIIANCENILDSRQTRFENIVIPPTVAPTFREVYAPLDGRVFNVAIRIKI
ncbi:MAG: TonB-dependent receptor [Bacteroidetes bacterium]|nr:TonB-dependent receptor [Bacteroidota bacterium]